MNLKSIISYLSGFLFTLLLIYFSSCDSRGGLTNPVITPPPPPNPYGEGNGKITFYRTQAVEGKVVIKVASKQLNDTLIWQTVPSCDTNSAASVILKAGSYSASLEADIFLCHYDFTIEERICKMIDYTNCAGGHVGCVDITGTWLRTGDTKWSAFNINDCSMSDLARDQYGGSPKFISSTLSFSDKNSLIINGDNIQIPYTRISQTNDKKITKHNYPFNIPADNATGMQVAR